MVSSSPASRVSACAGRSAKSRTSARGWTWRRTRAAAAGSGRRQIRGSPSAAITSAIPVRLSPMPSAASAAAISSMECPAARSSRIRSRAASLAGAVFGPGLPEQEELGCPGPEVAHRGEQAGGGVAEPGGCLSGG